MYVPYFNGSWAKIEWAKRHRDSLNRYAAQTFAVEANHPTIGIKFKPDTGEYFVYVSETPDLSLFLTVCSLFLGDAIHSLRAALDHLTFQLARRHKNGRVQHENRIQFPIEDDPAVFKRRKQEGGWIAEVAAVDQDAIEDFQPYLRRHEGRMLALLRNCSNADKHRLLIPVIIPATRFEGDNVFARMIVNEHIRRDQENFGLVKVRAIELGAELYWASAPSWKPSEVETEVAGHVTPEIAFDWEGRLARPVQSIDEIAAVVTNVIRKFDPIV